MQAERQKWVKTNGTTGRRLNQTFFEIHLRKYQDEITGLKQWVRMLKAISMLPPHLVPVAWAALSTQPHLPNVSVREKLQLFDIYFPNTCCTLLLAPCGITLIGIPC